MGKKDNIIKGYFRDKNRFADLFNGVCFDGKQVIKASELEEISGLYVGTGTVVADNNKKKSWRSRDIKMRLKSGETLKLLALENQNKVDYTMPVRCMQYDAMEYGQQMEELKKENREKGSLKTDGEFLCGMRKEDRLAPVYTLCLYHGEESWDGPRSLKDMMDFGEDGDGMSHFFADYPLHLLCINEEQDFSRFHTEIRQLFGAMQYRKDKKQLLQMVEENEEYRHLDMETLEAVSVLLDIPQIWENRERYMTENEKEKETGDMCQAIRELMEDAKNEGIEQGIKQGVEQGIKQSLKAFIEFAQEMNLSKEDTIQKLKEKYGLVEESLCECVEEYWK